MGPTKSVHGRKKVPSVISAPRGGASSWRHRSCWGGYCILRWGLPPSTINSSLGVLTQSNTAVSPTSSGGVSAYSASADCPVLPSGKHPGAPSLALVSRSLLAVSPMYALPQLQGICYTGLACSPLSGCRLSWLPLSTETVQNQIQPSC